ncbi:MAG TPA: energy transducer TonB [Gemmatimonadaceae bacterium]|jgi:TonB family protein
MIRSVRHSQAATQTPFGPALVSAAIHAAMIAAWFILTLQRPVTEPVSAATSQLLFVMPPDRSRAQAGSQAAAQYVPRNEQQRSDADLIQPKHEASRDTVATAAQQPTPARNTTTTMGLQAVVANDSVYSVLDVDSAVVRSPMSAAPEYPPVLVAARIQGFVTVRYVVDTTGAPDTTTFSVLESTNGGFTAAVRHALPGMRFTPAIIGSRKVRQSVKEQFIFRLTERGTVFSSLLSPYGRP